MLLSFFTKVYLLKCAICAILGVVNKKALHTLEYDKIIASLEALAYTQAAKKLCHELEPSCDIDEIRAWQTATTDARLRITRQGGTSFNGIRDYTGSLIRTDVGSTLNPSELLVISSALDATAKVKNYGRKSEPDEADSLTESFDKLEPLTPLNTEIKRCIISEDEIADDASPGLKSVRRSMQRIDERVHAALNNLLVAARPYLQDAVVSMRDGRYCLPVKAEYKAKVPGLVHDQSGSGSTYFVEPMQVVNLGNELKELEIKEKKEIELVLAGLSSRVGESATELKRNYRILIDLDFAFAKGALSAAHRASEPKFSEDRHLDLKHARHPLLDPNIAKANDIYLGDTFDLLVITGPNTGGKTVTLKTIGLLSLMGQAGLHIPARDGSVLGVFDDIFADIGDEQSIEQSLSTFSAHMTNIVNIMAEADSRSLVLFDELGAGTDPTEGAALAISILSRLHRMGTRTAATTHYSELKVFALETKGVENACCEFDVATLRPTYRLLIGIPGKSNAFAISKKLGLSDDIIEEAKEGIGERDTAFEDLITDLELRRLSMEEKESEAERLRAEIESLRKEVASKKVKLEEQKEQILREAREEARSIMQDAKTSIDKAISKMNKAGIGVDKDIELERAALRKKIDETNDKLKLKSSRSGNLKPSDLHIGDGIRVLSLGLNGTVSTLPDSKGNLFVQMGIMRSQVKLSDIELLEDDFEIGKKDVKSTGRREIKAFSVGPEINLVGKTVDEATNELDKYLDDAFLANIASVRIIHGRGTGTLKAAVQSMLRKNKNIKSYRAGEYGEGGIGVTIAVFK